jgi:hypothetical protein
MLPANGKYKVQICGKIARKSHHWKIDQIARQNSNSDRLFAHSVPRTNVRGVHFTPALLMPVLLLIIA